MYALGPKVKHADSAHGPKFRVKQGIAQTLTCEYYNDTGSVSDLETLSHKTGLWTTGHPVVTVVKGNRTHTTALPKGQYVMFRCVSYGLHSRQYRKPCRPHAAFAISPHGFGVTGGVKLPITASSF